jgi:hypothetical protein
VGVVQDMQGHVENGSGLVTYLFFNKRVPYGVWICPSYPSLFRCTVRSYEPAPRSRVKWICPQLLFIVSMNYEAQSILNSVGAGPDSLLALLIVEMRKANQLAQEQQEILKDILYEVNRSRILVHTIGQRSGFAS